jgi:hypothetical protein
VPVVRNITKQTRWPMSSSNLVREEMTCDLVLIPLRSLSLFPVIVFLFLPSGEGFFQDFAGAGRGRFIWTNQLACCFITESILPLSRFYPRCNEDTCARCYKIYHTLNPLLIYKENETNSSSQLIPISSTRF